MTESAKPVLFLVPARGGSKGVPRKNVLPLAGRPLIAHVLAAATAAQGLLAGVAGRLVVSTDNEEIAAVARGCGAEIPVLRPAELARDDAPSIEAVLHMLDVLEATGSFVPAAVVLLQPTSPLVAPSDIVGAVGMFFASGCSVVSVTENEHPLEWCYLLEEQALRPAVAWPAPARRQDARKTYRLNGAIYVAAPAQLRASRSFRNAATQAWVMPPERSIDIDTGLDFVIAETQFQSS